MNWIITRPTGILKAVRFRDANNRLVIDRNKAMVYPTASAALAAAHEGDVIVSPPAPQPEPNPEVTP